MEVAIIQPLKESTTTQGTAKKIANGYPKKSRHETHGLPQECNKPDTFENYDHNRKVKGEDGQCP
jgi:hypothetical protein